MREPHPAFIETPSGAATVETYTVIFDRDGAPERGIVFGRDAERRRFIANTPGDRRTLESMMKHEIIGTKGTAAQSEDGRNVFYVVGAPPITQTSRCL